MAGIEWKSQSSIKAQLTKTSLQIIMSTVMVLTKVFIFQDCMLQSVILPNEGKVIIGKSHVLYKDDSCKKHDFQLIASKNVF